MGTDRAGGLRSSRSARSASGTTTGDVAQLAAQDLCKVEVEGSSPFVSTNRQLLFRRDDPQSVLNGPLRNGLSPDEAAIAYSSLANPYTYRTLTATLGWSADHFEDWLRTNLRTRPAPPVIPGTQASRVRPISFRRRTSAGTRSSV